MKTVLVAQNVPQVGEEYLGITETWGTLWLLKSEQ